MTTIERDEMPSKRAEVRVLGPLRVLRADGTVVSPAELRTAQTADLLRLLALRVDEPVAVDVLIEALWPTVDKTRGRASLRTAASCIRRVLGEDCVQRRLGGLLLTGAWVDAREFRELAHEARRQVLTGELANAVATTRAAEALYLGEFRSHNDNSAWALQERAALAATFRRMVADGADAAAGLARWHDTVDLAERTLQVEPCSERAYRALMRAQRGLGETPMALKTYDRCRRVLAEEVGADPSAETHALYLELFVEPPEVPAPDPPDELNRLFELAVASELVAEPMRVGLPDDGRAWAGSVEADEVAVSLRRAVRVADERGDPVQQASARASLVRTECIPRRRFRAARRWTRQALALTVDPLMCAEILGDAWLAGAVLGDARRAQEALGAAAARLGVGHADDCPPALAALRCLVAHDLGRRDFGALQAAASGRAVLDDPSGYLWVAVRVATERGDLAVAARADRSPTPVSAAPVVRQLRGCASAALAMELGRVERARALLLGVLDVAAQTGSTLPVPEALARLIVLEAYSDLAGARRRFEQFEACVGADSWLPRENVLKLIARAAIRSADGRPDDAASAAAAAADAAERAGLVFLAAAAHRLRGVHLSAAGLAYDARLAVATAGRWRRSALAVAAPATIGAVAELGGEFAGEHGGDVVDFAGPRAPRRLRIRGLPSNRLDLPTAPFEV